MPRNPAGPLTHHVPCILIVFLYQPSPIHHNTFQFANHFLYVMSHCSRGPLPIMSHCNRGRLPFMSHGIVVVNKSCPSEVGHYDKINHILSSHDLFCNFFMRPMKNFFAIDWMNEHTNLEQTNKQHHQKIPCVAMTTITTYPQPGSSGWSLGIHSLNVNWFFTANNETKTNRVTHYLKQWMDTPEGYTQLWIYVTDNALAW